MQKSAIRPKPNQTDATDDVSVFTIKASNLPEDMKEDDLRELCEAYGNILYIKMDKFIQDMSLKCAGSAFVHYTKKFDALNAIASLDNFMYENRNLKFELASNIATKQSPSELEKTSAVVERSSEETDCLVCLASFPQNSPDLHQYSQCNHTLCTSCLKRAIEHYEDETLSENNEKCPTCLHPYETENTSDQIHNNEENLSDVQAEIAGSEILSDQNNHQSDHQMPSSSNQGLIKLPKKSKPINFVEHKE